MQIADWGLRIAKALLPVLVAAVGYAEEQTPEAVARVDKPTCVFAGKEGAMFVLDGGAGKLLKFDGERNTEVVRGYAVGTAADYGGLKIGPRAAAISADGDLIIGDGAESPDGLLRVFRRTNEAAVERDAARDKIGPLRINNEVVAEHRYDGIVATADAVFVVSNAGESPGQVLKSAINGTKFGPLEVWAPGEERRCAHPTAITIHPEEGHVVVGRQGHVCNSGDSHLTIYSRLTAKPLLDSSAKLLDIRGLAYSPKTGLLYAVDIAWKRPEEAGLYRLDAEFTDAGQSIRKTRIAKLDRPSSLAFAADGGLWVTLLGAEEGAGSVVKFKPGL